MCQLLTSPWVGSKETPRTYITTAGDVWELTRAGQRAIFSSVSFNATAYSWTSSATTTICRGTGEMLLPSNQTLELDFIENVCTGGQGTGWSACIHTLSVFVTWNRQEPFSHWLLTGRAMDFQLTIVWRSAEVNGRWRSGASTTSEGVKPCWRVWSAESAPTMTKKVKRPRRQFSFQKKMRHQGYPWETTMKTG